MAEGEKINVTEDISAEDTAGQETGHMKGAIAGMCSKHHGDRGKSRVQVGRADNLIAAATPELGLAGPEAGGRHRRNRTAFQAKKTAGKRYQRGAQPVKGKACGHMWEQHPREISTSLTHSQAQAAWAPATLGHDPCA